MTTTTNAVSAAPAFAESTLAALLRGFTKERAALGRAERDVEYYQDRIEELHTQLAELREALGGAEQSRAGARLASDKLEREARRLGADDDDIYEAARASYNPYLP